MSYAATMTQKGQITIPSCNPQYIWARAFKPAYLFYRKERIPDFHATRNKLNDEFHIFL